MEQSHPLYSYAILRFLTDAERDVTAAAGVILWSNDGCWHRFRLFAEGEQGSDLPAKTTHYLTLVQAQIEGWIRNGHLPYAPEPLPVLSHAWWQHVQKLLQFSVRVDAARPLAVDDLVKMTEEIVSICQQSRV